MIKESKETGFEILGTGYYFPEEIITNESYEKLYGYSATWIERVTGIKKRHKAGEDEQCSDMAVEAAKMALANAHLEASEIDLIILSSMAPDFTAPPAACIIQQKLGAVNAKSFDIPGSCTGFVTAMHIASMYIDKGLVKHALVLGSEKGLHGARPHQKEIFILLGDGAGAAVMGPSTTQSAGCITSEFGTDADNWDVATVKGGGSHFPTYDPLNGDEYRFNMNGKRIYQLAIKHLKKAINSVLETSGRQFSDIKLLVPHQANHRILQTLLKEYNLDSSVLYDDIENTGNTGAASIAISLARAYEKKLIVTGDLILLVAFGAGFNWSVMLVRV